LARIEVDQVVSIAKQLANEEPSLLAVVFQSGEASVRVSIGARVRPGRTAKQLQGLRDDLKQCLGRWGWVERPEPDSFSFDLVPDGPSLQ
jgi:hypothetical protein